MYELKQAVLYLSINGCKAFYQLVTCTFSVAVCLHNFHNYAALLALFKQFSVKNDLTCYNANLAKAMDSWALDSIMMQLIRPCDAVSVYWIPMMQENCWILTRFTRLIILMWTKIYLIVNVVKNEKYNESRAKKLAYIG